MNLATQPTPILDETGPQVADTIRRRRHARQRQALMAGGVLFAAGNMLHPLQHSDAAYDAPTWTAAHLTIFASLPLIVLGLPTIGRALAARIGAKLSGFAQVATLLGLFGLAPGLVIEAFVAPVIGYDAMRELESGGMEALMALLGGAYLGGSIALGWAAHSARLRPRWAGPALVVSAVAMVAVMSSTSRAAGAVIIAATSMYGLALAALASLRTRR
jgi:hypothetical protein